MINLSFTQRKYDLDSRVLALSEIENGERINCIIDSGGDIVYNTNKYERILFNKKSNINKSISIQQSPKLYLHIRIRRDRIIKRFHKNNRYGIISFKFFRGGFSYSE